MIETFTNPEESIFKLCFVERRRKYVKNLMITFFFDNKI